MEEERSVGEREHALAEFLREMRACDACLLRAGAIQPVVGAGPLGAPLMLVGEAPGAEEDRLGIPFTGPAGKLLDRSLAKLGVDRSRLYVTNVLKFRPPGNRMPHAGEVAACLPHLVRQIELVRPKIVGALGAVAAQTLLGTKDGLKKLRGAYREARGVRVFPMYHPAYALRNLDRDPGLLVVFETDLRRVCRDAGLTP